MRLVAFCLGATFVLAACSTEPKPACEAGEKTVRACTVTHGTGEQSRDCVKGQWGEYAACAAVSCETGYTLSAGACVPPSGCEGAATEACAVTHGSGRRSRTCEAGSWSAWSACQPISCDSGYQLDAGVCVAVACTGDSSQACSIEHGAGVQTRTCGTTGTWSAWGVCTVQSCATGYEVSGEECVAIACAGASTQACAIDHGTGEQTRTCTTGAWSSWSTCTAKSCDSGYEISNGQCVAVTCTGASSQACTVTHGTGEQTRTCANGAWSAWGACAAKSCDSGYALSNGQCAPVGCSGSATQACTIAHGTGAQTRTCEAGGTWSAWGACTVASCDPGYVISGNGCAVDQNPPGATFYVSPSGDDAHAGTQAAPFKTLERARDAIRTLKGSGGLPAGGVVVYLRGGAYYRSSTFQLEAQDSGAAGKPIKYVAYPGEAVRVSGGLPLDVAGFQLVTSASPVWSRIDASARGKVYAFDLSAVTTDYGTLQERGYETVPTGALELMFEGEVMQLGRYPNKADTYAGGMYPAQLILLGDARSPAVNGPFDRVQLTQNPEIVYGNGAGWYIASDHDSATPIFRLRQCTVQTGTGGRQELSCSGPSAWWGQYTPWGFFNADGNASGQIYVARAGYETAAGMMLTAPGSADTTVRYLDTFTTNRVARWANAPDAWVHGIWGWGWTDWHAPVTAVNAAGKTLTLGAEVGLEAYNPFYVYNLLEEVDAPGEYWLDRQSGTLYFYPPAPLAGAAVYVSMLEGEVARVEASHITFTGITFDATRGTVLHLEGERNFVNRCKVKNSGMHGIVLAGKQSAVYGSEIAQVGAAGIRLLGGDRRTLEYAGHVVKNNDIHHFGRLVSTYQPGVDISQVFTTSSIASFSGVGMTIERNEIHHTPHSAIIFWGNDATIRGNDIHHVGSFTDDAGAVYSGRDWAARGNVIARNHFHDIYGHFNREAGFMGIYLDDAVSGNKIYGNIFQNIAGIAVMLSGGRDTPIENNLVVDTAYMFLVTSRGAHSASLGAFNDPDDNWNLLGKMQAVNYPSLATRCQTSCPADEQTFRLWTYQQLALYPNTASAYFSSTCPTGAKTAVNANCYLYPQLSTFQHNVGYRVNDFSFASEWETGATDKLQSISPNVTQLDGLFADPANPDFHFPTSSPLYSLSGFTFEPIPVDQNRPLRRRGERRVGGAALSGRG
ncbi:MAG: right-handed parallel beta-helix repeat-containing protein [Myxococcales bacterium]